jgi:uncharacterized repeat protein (TIGR03803 family)
MPKEGISYMQRLACARFVLLISFLILMNFTVIQSAAAQTFTVIHNFTGGADGGQPVAGITKDARGNLYGTTSVGGSGIGYGTVYELTHNRSSWIFAPLYTFAGGSDGESPQFRVVIGPGGSLYGTTYQGGACSYFGGCGTVFSLRPPVSVCPNVNCSWPESVLYRFQGPPNDGWGPYSDLVFGQDRSLYGTTLAGGTGTCLGGAGCGVIYQLKPSGGSWTESVIHNFSGIDGAEPTGAVIFDRVGNLYGTASASGQYGYGSVYELMPSGTGWLAQVLYSFDAGSDGANPEGGVVFDQSGNLYGVTNRGGATGGGTIYELSPSSGGWILTILYSFSGFSSLAQNGLIMDGSGNLYGTTYNGGPANIGTVFKLARSNGVWTYTLLHDFSGSDGAYPTSSATIDSNGNLYGTTSEGGSFGQGVLYEITPN